MNKIFLLFCFLFLSIDIYSQNSVNQEWNILIEENVFTTKSIVKTDFDGYIYWAGTIVSDSTSKDWFIGKYAPNGDSIWTRKIDHNRLDDIITDMQIANNGSIYLTGSFAYDTSQTSYSLIKCDSSGSVIWQEVSTPKSGKHTGSVLRTDSLGNIYWGVNINTSSFSANAIILKFNTSGTEQWRDTVGLSGKKELIDLALAANGNVAACLNFNSPLAIIPNWDILLWVVDSNGDYLFDKVFSGSSLGDDFCKGIVIDNENNIYIGGNSINRGTSDYLTIKYDESGTQKWYAFFDENYGFDEVTDIMEYGDYVYVTGNVSADSSLNTEIDIVTIQYKKSTGIHNWKQKFSGRDNGDDKAIKLLLNADSEIIVAGTSWNNTSSNDVFLICYNEEGDVLWSLNGIDTTTHSQITQNATVDFLGNIYLTSSTVDTSTTNAELFKFNQQHKTIPILENYLKMLATGIMGASATDTLIRFFLHQSCEQAIDSFFHISYFKLIDSCQAHNYNLKAVMNEYIGEFFNLDSADHVGNIFKNFWLLGYKQRPLLAIPHYHHLSSSELLESPYHTWSLVEKEYPIPCINCDGGFIEKDETESTVTWITMLWPKGWYFINGNTFINIANCTATLPMPFSSRCAVCPQNSNYSQLTAGTFPGGTQNHEIEIKLGSGGVMQNDYCYDNFVITSLIPIAPPYGYAKLKAVQTLPFYRRVPYSQVPTNENRIYKMDHPICDRLGDYDPTSGMLPNINDDNNWLFGDAMTICELNPLFNTTDETGVSASRWSLGFGLYQIYRPGINQKPVYFYFPFAKALWYSQGPDMGIYYGNDGFTNNCISSGAIQIEEDYETEQCDFCGTAPLSTGIPANDIRKYLATTDLNEIQNYWLEEVVTVGFTTSGASIPSGSSGISGINVVEFTSQVTPSGCTPSGNLVVQLDLLPPFSSSNYGIYQTSKRFDNNISIPANTTLEVFVEVNFESGKSINECKQITLQPSCPVPPCDEFKLIFINFRGRLEDYNSSIINYRIRVYQ